ncbi:phage holin family protein [Geodermatophilus sp. SYSU D00815]
MTSGIPGIRAGDLAQPLGEELLALVRQEVRRLQRDYLGKARQGRTGARLLGGAAVLGSMSAGSTTALVIRLLERRPGTAPGVTALVFGAGAAALAAAGRARLRQAWAPLPSSPAETA